MGVATASMVDVHGGATSLVFVVGAASHGACLHCFFGVGADPSFPSDGAASLRVWLY